MAKDTDAVIERPPEAPAKGAEDLSAEIAGAVERQPGDVVRCTRIGDHNYRCNWWAPEPTAGYDNPSMEGLLITTHRVRQSRFLWATKTTGGRLDMRGAPARQG